MTGSATVRERTAGSHGRFAVGVVPLTLIITLVYSSTTVVGQAPPAGAQPPTAASDLPTATTAVGAQPDPASTDPFGPPSPSVVKVQPADTSAAAVWGAVIPDPVGDGKGYFLVAVPEVFSTAEDVAPGPALVDKAVSKRVEATYDQATVSSGDSSYESEFVDYVPMLATVLLRAKAPDVTWPTFPLRETGVQPNEQVIVHHGGTKHVGKLTLIHADDTFPWRVDLDDGTQPDIGAPVTDADGRLVGIVKQLTKDESEWIAANTDAKGTRLRVLLPAEFIKTATVLQDDGLTDSFRTMAVGAAWGVERGRAQQWGEPLSVSDRFGAVAPPAEMLANPAGPDGATTRGGLAGRLPLGRGMPAAGVDSPPVETEMKVFRLANLTTNDALVVLNSLFRFQTTFSEVPSQRMIIAYGAADNLQTIEALLKALDIAPSAGPGDAAAAPVQSIVQPDRSDDGDEVFGARRFGAGGAAPPFGGGRGAMGMASGGPSPQGEIKIFHLQHLSPDEVVSALSPLFGQGGRMGIGAARPFMESTPTPTFVAVPSRSILIARGAADDLRKIETLIQALDVPGATAPHADIGAAEALNAGEDAAGAAGRQSPPNTVEQKFQLKGTNWRDMVARLEELRKREDTERFEMDCNVINNTVTVRGSEHSVAAAAEFIRSEDPQAEVIVATGELMFGPSDPVPTDPALVEQLRAEYAKHDVAVRERVAQLRRAGDDAQAGYIRQSLQSHVANAFNARQALQRAELAELGTKLNAMRRTLEARERIKEQIVQRRVEELLNPALEWDASGAPAAGAIDATTGSRTIHSDWPVPFTKTVPDTGSPIGLAGPPHLPPGQQPAAGRDPATVEPATPERLYQGRTELEWQRLFAAETDPVAKLEAAVALVNLSAALSPDQRMQRILDVGDNLVRWNYGDDSREFAFESLPPQRWSVGGEGQRTAYMQFHQELERIIAALPATVTADELAGAITGQSVSRAAFAFSLLIYAARSPIGADEEASRALFERLSDAVATTGGDASALALLGALQFSSVATEDELGQLAQQMIAASQALHSGATDSDTWHSSFRDWLIGSRLPDAMLRDSGATRALAELIVVDVVTRGRTTSSLVDPLPTVIKPSPVPADKRTLEEMLREIHGSALHGWVAIANDYLQQHRTGPSYSDADRSIVRGTLRATALYSDGDDWPVTLTADIFTEQLRAAYTDDPAATVDQPMSELLPATPAEMLAQIVAVTGEIPGFVKIASPKSAIVARKLATLDQLLAGEIGFRRSDEELRTLTGLLGEAPTETVFGLLTKSTFDENQAVVRVSDRGETTQLAGLLNSGSLLYPERPRLPDDHSRYDGRRQSIDPLLLLAIFAELTGDDANLDARIASLEALDLHGTAFRDHIKQLLASRLQSRHHAARMLRDMAAKTESPELRDMIRAIDPKLVEIDEPAADPADSPAK